MSLSADRESRQTRRICQSCRERKGRCFECYRADRERRRALLQAELPAATPLRPHVRPALTDRQIAHRRVMLAFARARSS